jgi:hypothetical protein
MGPTSLVTMAFDANDRDPGPFRIANTQTASQQQGHASMHAPVSSAPVQREPEARVCAIRHGYHIAVYQDGEREGRGELNMLEAAKELGVERRVISELVKTGHLPASQVCAHAPWVIRREDLYSAQVQGVLRKGKFRAPCAENQKQLLLKNQ